VRWDVGRTLLFRSHHNHNTFYCLYHCEVKVCNKSHNGHLGTRPLGQWTAEILNAIDICASFSAQYDQILEVKVPKVRFQSEEFPEEDSLEVEISKVEVNDHQYTIPTEV